MTETIWKPVKGYEGLYEVSTLGQVRSLPRVKRGKFRKNGSQSYHTTKEKLLKPKVAMDGYFTVTLCDKNGSRKFCRVHRIVATAFIDNPYNNEIVRHKDENILNNCVENLTWVTPRENLFASDVFGKLSRIFSTPIVCRTTSGEFVGEYESVSKASKSLGIDVRNISSVVNGRRNHTRGYVFERKLGNHHRLDPNGLTSC